MYSSISGELTVTARRNLAQLNEEASGSWNGSYQINPDQSEISTYNLPYVPGYEWSGNLDNQVISLNATHQDRKKTV